MVKFINNYTLPNTTESTQNGRLAYCGCDFLNTFCLCEYIYIAFSYLAQLVQKSRINNIFNLYHK